MLSAFRNANPFFPVRDSISRCPIDSNLSQSFRASVDNLAVCSFRLNPKLIALCTSLFRMEENCWMNETWSGGSNFNLQMNANLPRLMSLLSMCGNTSSSSGLPNCEIKRWFSAVSIMAWSMITSVQSFLLCHISSKNPGGSFRVSIAHLLKAASCARTSAGINLSDKPIAYAFRRLFSVLACFAATARRSISDLGTLTIRRISASNFWKGDGSGCAGAGSLMGHE